MQNDARTTRNGIRAVSTEQRPLTGAERVEDSVRANIQLDLDANPITEKPLIRKFPSIKLPFEMRTLKRRNQWDKLFDGFTEMKAITFVSQPEFLLDYFESRGYLRIELLVGKGLVDRYKDSMEETKWQVIQKIKDRTSSGDLVLWGTKDLIHTKMYILKNDSFTRVIVGSPNLSYKASGSGQVEFVVYWDLSHENSSHQSTLKKFMSHYESHYSDKCSKFMEDLSDLFIELEDLEPKEIIRIWKSSSQQSDMKQRRAIYSELNALALQESANPEDDMITIEVPKISKSSKRVLTESFGANFQGSEMTVSRSKYLKADSHLGIPQLKLEEDVGELRLGIHGKMEILTGREWSQENLFKDLEDIERFIGMVDNATCDAPDYVKMSMMETVIYSFAAPFANHWLRSKRQVTNYSNRRGPRHLLLFGDGFNGKTTFLRYINWLISGSHIEPVDAKKYAKDDWVNLFSHIQTSGSMMPVPIDDVKKRAVQGASPTLEQFIKPYFENEWHDALNFPMLVLSSNYSVNGDWAKSRVRRLDFDVQFSGEESDEMLINDLLSRRNSVFGVFATDYVSRLAVGSGYRKDELFDAREIMRGVYEKAGKDTPSYFPDIPPEERFDVDAIYCFRQIRRHKLVSEKRKNGVIHLSFTGRPALHEFRGKLPQTIKSQYADTELVIENPEVFDKFLSKGDTGSRRGSFLTKIFRWK